MKNETTPTPTNPEPEENIDDVFAQLPIPKVTDLALAQDLVAKGYVEKLEDIYVELTPEQKAHLEAKREQLKRDLGEFPSMQDIPWD